MAWNYAQYVGRVAAAGKAEYPIPMYVNAWLVQRTGEKPGSYPSGGPVAQVHDLWRAGARRSTSLRPTSTGPISRIYAHCTPAPAIRSSFPRPGAARPAQPTP